MFYDNLATALAFYLHFCINFKPFAHPATVTKHTLPTTIYKSFMPFLRNLLDSLATNRHNAYWQRTAMMTHSSRSHTTASFWHSLVSFSPIAAYTYQSYIYVYVFVPLLTNNYCIVGFKANSTVFVSALLCNSLFFLS